MAPRLLPKIWRNRRYVGLLRPRCRGVAYLGWTGRGNLGDDMLWDAAVDAFPGTDLEQWPTGAAAEVLTRLGAACPLSGVLLGGGTLVGTARYRVALNSLSSAVGADRTVILGAGVEHPEFATGGGRDVEKELRRWLPLLRTCQVSVRGPRSARLLADAGVDAPVVADPALPFARQWRSDASTAGTTPSPPRLGVSLIDTRQIWGGNPQAVADAVTSYCLGKIGAGWEVFLMPMSRDDVALHSRMQQVLGSRSKLLLHWDSSDRFLSALSSCSLTLGARLHAGIAATALKIPTMMIGYGPKHVDFADSTGQQEALLRTDEVSAKGLAACEEWAVDEGNRMAVDATVDHLCASLARVQDQARRVFGSSP